MRKTGLFLLAIGLVLTLLIEFNFFTQEKVVDLGKIEIIHNKPHRFDWTPIAGISIMAVGAAFYVFGKRPVTSMHVMK
jgi:hypothetical protein